MKQISHCKFCGTQVILDIDEDYEKLGDPFKLIPYAACDRCADLREERRRMDDRIKFACKWLESQSAEKRKKHELKIKDRLVKLTQQYAKFVAKWYGLDGMWWDEEFPAMLGDFPDKWPQILSDYWKHFRQMNPPKLLI